MSEFFDEGANCIHLRRGTHNCAIQICKKVRYKQVYWVPIYLHCIYLVLLQFSNIKDVAVGGLQRHQIFPPFLLILTELRDTSIR